MRTAARRREGGRPLREAMREAGRVTYQGLAAATRKADPDGRGVSFQLIAALVTDRSWGRDTTSPQTARLIAAGLGKPVEALFDLPAIAMPRKSS